jgi:Dolichyl-phosphate-mannose-protein mannosyltransferase
VTTYIFGVRASSHRPVPALLVGWIVLLMMGADRVRARLMQSGELLEKYGRVAAIGLAVVTLIVGLSRGAFTAAGADPYGYVSQARLWMTGSIVQSQHGLARDAPWAHAAWSFSPLGYVPSPDPAYVVPAYPAGLPLQMALAMTLGGPSAGYVVVPLLGALAVWLTFLLGRRVSGSGQGLAAALLFACSPVFLFQLVQPMTDVPVTTWWLAAIVAASSGRVSGAAGAGLAASLALLTRPNLALLLLPVFVYAYASTEARKRWKTIVAFAAAILPGLAIIAIANTALFGTPLRSGYGSLPEIFHVSNMLPNLTRYPVWATQTYSPFIFLGFAGVLLGPTSGVFKRTAWLTIAFAVLLFASYVFYTPFDHWTYLRFLLPATPLLFVTAVPTLDRFLGRWERARPIVFTAIVSTLAVSYVHTAVRGDAFALKRSWQTRYEDTARFVTQRFSERAAFVSLLQSGSLRFYADRLTIRYDVLEPSALAQVGPFLRSNGYDPYIAIDGSEQEAFQRQFGSVPLELVAVFYDVYFYRAP